MNVYQLSKAMLIRTTLLVLSLVAFLNLPSLANAGPITIYEGKEIKDVDSLEGTVEKIDYIKGHMMLRDSVLVVTKAMKVKSATGRSLSRYSVKKNQRVKVTYAYDRQTKREIVDTVIILGK